MCRALLKWFAEVPEATIDFVDVPTIAGWAPHKGVHDYLRTLPRVPGVRPALTYDSVRSWATDEVTRPGERTFFRDPSYAGRQVPQYEGHQRQHSKGRRPSLGVRGYLPSNESPRLSWARMTRAVLGHAPIGEYFARFNIDEPHGCSCDPHGPSDPGPPSVSVSTQTGLGPP